MFLARVREQQTAIVLTLLIERSDRPLAKRERERFTSQLVAVAKEARQIAEKEAVAHPGG